MSFTYRRAVRESMGLLIGIIGASGSGKSFSAMRLAKGICGSDPFCVIDTEAGRAKHYADMFTFDHGDLKPPFRPAAYADAIKAADQAGYKVIIVDSASHEHAGEGGLLDWHEEEMQRMAGDDWKKREAVKMAAWIKPKMEHKKMVQRLLQVRAHLILAFRAEERVEMVKGDDGKTRIVPKGFMPITEKNLPYELTCSFLLTPDAPGIPKPIKLQQQHRDFFRLDQPLDEKAGELLAQWASGGKKPAAPAMTGEKKAAYDAQAPSAGYDVDELRQIALELLRKANGKITTAKYTQAESYIQKPNRTAQQLMDQIEKLRGIVDAREPAA